MGPKKKSAEEGEDLSTEQFWKCYKKLCTQLDVTPSKAIKERYDTDYLENGDPITKVSLAFVLTHFTLVQPLGTTRLARCKVHLRSSKSS